MSTSLRDQLLSILTSVEDTDTPTDLSRVTSALLPPSDNKQKRGKEWKCAFIIPDPQIGLMEYEDGSQTHFHDIDAITVMFQIMNHIESIHGIDLVVNVGDTIDLPQFGTYAQAAAYANTANKSFKITHDFLAMQRAVSPLAQIVMLEGNHECRLQKYINRLSPSISQVRRVGDEKYPVNSLPYLLALDTIDIEYISGYPASKFYINPNLIAVHGTKARSNGSTAYQYINANPMQTVIFGHSHRFEMAYKTHDTQYGPVQNGAFSPGCLSRVDGAVPSVNGGLNLDEKPVTHWENWQQGCGVVWYKDSGEFTIEPIHIMKGWAVYSGVEFRAKYN